MKHWHDELILASERRWGQILGLACTDYGLSLGHASLIERRGGRSWLERDDLDRLLKRADEGEPPVDRFYGRPGDGRPRQRGEVLWRVEFGSLKAV